MKTMQCFGKFNYDRHKIVAIVKILKVDKNEHFKAGCYYPVMYDFYDKVYGIMDHNYNINMFHYYSENINSVFKFLTGLKGCIFDTAYYINYTICNSKMFGKGFRSTFDVNWSLKKFTHKVVSKSGGVFWC